MTQSAANIRWGDVREDVLRELVMVQGLLETAALEDVPRLQGQIAALKSVIEWFERGAIAKRAILFTPNPHEAQD